MTVDASRSTRDQTGHVEHNEGEIQDKIAQIGQDIMAARELGVAILGDDDVTEAQQFAMGRVLSLFEESMNFPFTPEFITYHAETRGRMAELLRLRLMDEGVRKHLRTKESEQKTWKTRLADLIMRRDKDLS